MPYASTQDGSIRAPGPAPWLIVAMLCAISTISYIERVNITVVAPSLKEEFALSNKQLGSLSSAFLLGYALCQFPAGILADRLGPRRVLAGALLGWTGFTLLSAGVGHSFLIPGFGVLGTLLIVRFLLGITVSPTYPAAAQSIFGWVVGPRRALANAVVVAGIAVGTGITQPLVAHLVEYVGWRNALLFTAAFPLAMAVLWFKVGRDNKAALLLSAKAQSAPPGHLSGGNYETPNLRPHWSSAAFLRDKNLWLLTMSYALQGYISYIFVFWFREYLIQERGLDMLESSWLAAMPWLLTLVTMPLGGILSDRLVRRLGYPWGRRWVPLVALVLAGILLSVGAREKDPYIAVAIFTFCEALVMAVEGVFWASVIEISREHSGSAGGILNMGGNLGGLPSPYVTPWIAEAFGWVAALDVGAAIAVLAGLMWFWISPGTNAPKPLVVEYPAGPPLGPKSQAITTDPSS